MNNVYAGIAVAVITAILVPMLGFAWYAGIAPALFLGVLLWFLLNRRTTAAVTAALAPMQEIAQRLQEAKTPEAQQQAIADMKALMTAVRDQWGAWQLMLEAQIDGQLGMLDYMQLRFDDALPQLLKGSSRDWTCQSALGCLSWRKNDLDAARKYFEAAAAAAPKEPMVYMLHGFLAHRKERRDEALAALSKGLAELPDHPQLRDLKNRVANKNDVEPTVLGQTFYQFFPEEMRKLQEAQVAQMTMRGRRGPPPEPPPGARYLMPPPQPKSRGKLARRR